MLMLCFVIAWYCVFSFRLYQSLCLSAWLPRFFFRQTAWLCEKFSLTEEDVIRHYDITGKICPKYFVENEDAWKQFKSDVKAVLDNAK